VAVTQHLAETEAELFFLVGYTHDLGIKGSIAFLPGHVEVGFVG
jgi:hypothetical protein